MPKILLILIISIFISPFQLLSQTGWYKIYSGPNADVNIYMDMVFLNQTTGFVCGGFQSGGTILQTTNAGVTWLTSLTTIRAILSIDFTDETTGYALGSGYGTYPGYYKTTDCGFSWSVHTLGEYYTYFDSYFFDSNTGFMVGDQGQIRKTTNGGDNWLVLNYPDDSKTVYFKDVNTGWLGGYGVMFKTTNSGVNWVLQSLPVSFMGYIYGLSKSNDSMLWAAGGTGYIHKTTNGGVGINQISTEVPGEYKLWQNYPNPFNPVTVIRFSLSVVSLSTLKIFDITGKEVATLVDEKLAPGTYSIEWNAAGYPSGVYFYQMSVGDFRETRRMILTK